MNFLAHLYLSGESTGVRIGNFIGDYVKGNSYNKFSPEIQKGILLHRRIDEFTDKHPMVKQSASLLQEHYGRYSGIIVDMFYDHYLAVNWNHYSDVELSRFVSGVHRMLILNYFKMPGRVKRFLPFLIKNRGLENYRNINGIERALRIMSEYSSLPAKTDLAIKVLNENYDRLNNDFKSFFPEVKEMSEKILEQ